MENFTEFISLIVPSRARPARLQDMLTSVENTVSGQHSVQVVVLLDSDDEQHYPRVSLEQVECTYIVGDPNRTMGSLNLEAVRGAKGDIIFLCNDDVLFETKNWDRILVGKAKSFHDKLYLMYPNDGIKKSRLATFPILNRNLVLENADLLPTAYQGSFIDLHIMDIFMELKRGRRIVYLDEISCRHVHFSEDNSLFDSTYENRDRFGDDSTFLEYSTRRKVLAGLMEDVSINRVVWGNSVVGLLLGRSKFVWRLRLFTYMLVRTLYRKVFA